MITLVVTTHGQLAEGFLDAVELIVGPQTNLYSVCLKAGDSFDEFQQNRDKEIACLTGVNLPLVIEAIFKREELTLKELAEYLVTIGKDGITALMFP